MTHIRSTVLAALVAFGGAAIAGAQAPAQAPAQVPARGAHQHAQRAQRAQHAWRGERKLGQQLFKGIQLSDAEKANVEAVRAKYAPQMKALREQFKPQFEQAREARQRGDTAALKNMWAQTSAERDQAKKALESERDDLRNALAPEHRAQFDANVTTFEQRVAKRATKAWTKRG